jgi:hypothetical protein
LTSLLIGFAEPNLEVFLGKFLTVNGWVERNIASGNGGNHMFTAFYNFRFQLSLKPNSGKGRGLIKNPILNMIIDQLGRKSFNFLGMGHS